MFCDTDCYIGMPDNVLGPFDFFCILLNNKIKVCGWAGRVDVRVCLFVHGLFYRTYLQCALSYSPS